MQMEHSEFLKIQAQMQEHFDGRYVKQTDCRNIVTEEDKKIDNLTIEFAKSNTKLNILIGILTTIAVPILGVCIKMLFGS